MIAARDPLAAPSAGRLGCRLRGRPPAPGRTQNPLAGEVELENLSAAPLDIPAAVHPLQYLDLRVTDASGAVVSAGWYGDQFSPAEGPADLRLLPGEKFIAPVALLGSVPAGRLGPGTYTVRAVYDCPGLRAASDPLTITL